ncbi:MAG: adenine-specific methyltransferase EcoRI family protein, partial [Mycoplasmoidaceae bacterium]
NDEFYTKYETICKELRSDEYKKQLKGKVIYCNCDDAKHSEFWRYFVAFYDTLELKGLITTYFPKNGEEAYMLELNKDVMNKLMKKHKLSMNELLIKLQDRNEKFFPELKVIKGDESFGGGILEVMNVLNF